MAGTAGTHLEGGLAGRSAEAGWLRSAVGQVAGGSGRTLVVVGEAGIGKTRAGVAIVALMFAAEVIPLTSTSDPPDPGDQWASAMFFLLVAVGFAVAAVIAARRQLREHPPAAAADGGGLG